MIAPSMRRLQLSYRNQDFQTACNERCEELRAEALAAGAHGVIGMPYDAVELLERLRELCERE